MKHLHQVLVNIPRLRDRKHAPSSHTPRHPPKEHITQLHKVPPPRAPDK